MTALLVMVPSAAGYVKAEGAIDRRGASGPGQEREREEAETDLTRKALQFARRRGNA